MSLVCPGSAGARAPSGGGPSSCRTKNLVPRIGRTRQCSCYHLSFTDGSRRPPQQVSRPARLQTGRPASSDIFRILWHGNGCARRSPQVHAAMSNGQTVKVRCEAPRCIRDRLSTRLSSSGSFLCAFAWPLLVLFIACYEITPHYIEGPGVCQGSLFTL